MRIPVSRHLIRLSTELEADDTAILKERCPAILEKVKKNVKDKKDPLADIDDDSRRQLLAYVVYLRENITADSPENVNEEDAAKILHEDIFGDNKKKTLEKLEAHLKKQLQKAGLNIEVKK